MKKIIYIVVIFSFFQMINGQTKRDPRVVGLSGAYTTIAEGIFCVGYNPALITRAHDKPFMLQVYQSDRGFLGNFFSIENVAQFSGDTLNNKEKDQLFENFEDGGGVSFFQDRHLPIPFLNFSKGNMYYFDESNLNKKNLSVNFLSSNNKKSLLSSNSYSRPVH